MNVVRRVCLEHVHVPNVLLICLGQAFVRRIHLCARLENLSHLFLVVAIIPQEREFGLELEIVVVEFIVPVMLVLRGVLVAGVLLELLPAILKH